MARNSRHLVVTLALALIAAACSVSTVPEESADGAPSDPTSTTAATPTTTTNTEASPADADPDGTVTTPTTDGGDSDRTTEDQADPNSELAEPPASLRELPGVLAVTDRGDRVVVLRPDGFDTQVIDGGNGRRASQPAWSPDGSLIAWSSFGADGHTIAVERLATGERLDIDADGSPAFYLNWSSNSDQLLFLRGSGSSSDVELWSGAPGATASFIGAGGPHFLSWAPSSDQWATHVDSNRLLLEGVASDEAAQLTATDGGFGPPDWWSETAVLGVVDSELSVIDVTTGEPIERLGPTMVDDPVRGIRFVLNRESGAVAYHLAGSDTGLLVRAADGSTTPVDGASSPAAWEWSPDGGRLAWLELVDGGRRLRWHFWDVGRSIELTATEPFTASQRDAQAYLPFFAQFAQSHRRWSPDGNGFAYAGSTTEGSGIWVQRFAADAPDAELVSGGDSVTWSPTGGAGTARTRV